MDAMVYSAAPQYKDRLGRSINYLSQAIAIVEETLLQQAECEVQLHDSRAKFRDGTHPGMNASSSRNNVAPSQSDFKPVISRMETTLMAILSELGEPEHTGNDSDSYAEGNKSSEFYQQQRKNCQLLMYCRLRFMATVLCNEDTFKSHDMYVLRIYRFKHIRRSPNDSDLVLCNIFWNSIIDTSNLVLVKDHLEAMRTALLADLFAEARTSL